MNINDIIIPEAFANTVPSKNKLEEVRNYYKKYGKVDKNIKVSDDGVLIDGYIRYLVLKENEPNAEVFVKHIDSYRSKLTTYVYGVHPNSICNKEYMWRMPNSSNYVPAVGEAILVKTSKGVAPAVVTRTVITDVCPVDNLVRKVIKWNGVKINSK